MYVKKNFILWVAVLALALPLLLTGTASAKYMSDGSAQNGTTGVYDAPTDGVCVKSLATDGTMVIVSSATTGRACQAVLVDVTAVTSNDTLASVCGTPSKNTDGVKYAAPGSSTCVTIDASGYITGAYSMANLDRGAVMCSGLVSGGQLANATPTTLLNGVVIATATKTTANGTAAKCIAYGFQYRGPSGTPPTFGAKGVTPAASGTGFCYTSVRTGISAAACPSTVVGTTVANTNARLGYSVSGAECLYAYGTSGVANAALTKIDGTVYKAAGAAVDLTALTQGECLANGASWANGWGFVTTGATYGTADGWTSGTGVKFDVTKNVLNADEGCLHCHSYTSQANGPAERFKDSFLLTGHKNMLRKVTAGKNWAGPDANGILQAYTAYAAGTLDFTAATAQVSGVDKPLLYIFGDWMAPAPGGLDVVVNMSGAAKYNGGSDYSCAACHTEGWSNATAGLCNYSSKTTQATCEAVASGAFGPGVWYPIKGTQAIGISDYAGSQPATDFPGITFGTAGQWDNSGISCGRCHNAAQANTNPTTIAASTFPTTLELKTGMGNLAAGVGRNNLCFGCHQSMAKTSNGIGTDADIANPTALIVKNTATAPAYVPDFSGHVLGNSFLNSVHSRFTGSVTPNALGKYDLFSNTAANYNSTFRGYVCMQSASSSSPAKTKADGTEIKDKATCEGLYGAGAWRADTGTTGSADSIQGTCTTCHDVHQSMFVNGQEGLRKECADCHNNSDFSTAVPGTFQATSISHPTGAGTPAGIDPKDSCAVCHMPMPTSGGFPMHVWRINSDPAYSTFPTAAEFGIGATATKKNANTATDSKGYTNAVWVDLNLACGQCHYATGLNYTAGNPVLTKDQLATIAPSMHGKAGNSAPNCLTCHSTAQGSKRAINPGVDHHNGTCTTCHAAGNGHYKSAWDTAGVAAPNTNATTLKPAGSHNPLPYWGINGSLSTACLGCHSADRVRSADGTTLKAIVPSGGTDNHHGGHASVPGTSFGGVSDVNGSRGDNDPGMNCAGCHGKSSIVSGNNTIGYTIKIAASGLSTSTVAAANGRVNTSGLCMGCHEVVQSGAGADHHAGTCTSCHKADGSWNGVFGAGVASPAADCTVCHNATSSPKLVIVHPTTAGTPGTGTTACDKCHDSTGNFAGVKPTDLQVACGQCHGGSSLTTTNGAPFRNLADLTVDARGMHTVPTPKTDPNPGPIVTATSAFSVDGFTATYVDASTSGSGNLSIRVTWGDGKTSIVAKGSTTTHVYTRARAYNAKATVYDMGVNGTFRKVLTDATVSKTLTVLPLSISGTVTASDGTTPIPGVVMTLEQVTTKTIVRKKAVTRADGTYTFANVLPNAATGPATSGTPYTLVATKAKGGFTFPAIPTFSVTNASIAGKNVSAN